MKNNSNFFKVIFFVKIDSCKSELINKFDIKINSRIKKNLNYNFMLKYLI